MLHCALRTRNLDWRRHQLGFSSGLRHPKRFKAWRWEEQLADFYGEVDSFDVAENAGWLLCAQQRVEWKSREADFSRFQ